MFKYFCLICFVFSWGRSVWADSDLRPFSDAAMAAISVDRDSIRGWESHHGLEEVLVKIYMVDGTIIEVQCEEQGCQEVDRYQVHFDHSRNSGITLELIKQGRDAAFAKFDKVLQRSGGSIGALTSYKVWIEENDGHGHERGLNVWTQMVPYGKNSVFVLCHPHGTKLSCHYRISPSWEPEGEAPHHEH